MRPEAWLMWVEATGHYLAADETLTRREAADEFLLMGLRLAEGIDLERFHAIAGFALSEDRIADLAAHGLMERTADGRLRATAAGFPLLDAIVADLAA
jgi:coproporphyrinogen III oxidase-like Fe-S oxidoreductase